MIGPGPAAIARRLESSAGSAPGLGGVLLCAALALAPGAAAASEADEPALVIRRGSVALRQVVALGRDLEVAGEAASDVAAVSGSIRVSGRVEGDVIALGGDVGLADGAVVGGDVFVLGGRLEAAPGARIAGRAAAYPSVSSAWIVLLEGPGLGLPAFSGVALAAKLALVAAWLAWTVLLFAVSGREMLATSEGILEQPFRNFVVGLAGVLAAFLTALLFAAFAASLVGLPLLVLVVLVALLLKLWGMAALFHALGHWLAGRLGGRRLQPLNAAMLGLVLLGAVKLLPWVGVWAWTAASLIGVGAALTTKLGRREPWFDRLELPGLAAGPSA